MKNWMILLLQSFTACMPLLSATSHKFKNCWYLCAYRCAQLSYTTQHGAHTHSHPFNGPFPGLPRWAGTRKLKLIWILLKKETESGSGISWAIFKSAPCSRETTTPAPHHSFFTGWMPFLPPNQQRQSTEGRLGSNTAGSSYDNTPLRPPDNHHTAQMPSIRERDRKVMQQVVSECLSISTLLWTN